MQAQDILNNLDIIAEKLFRSVETQVFKTLDDIVLIGTNILKVEPLKNVFYHDKINGLIMIANSIIVNSSYFICEQILNIVELFSNSIDIFSKQLAGQSVNFVNLKEAIISIEDFMKTDLISLDGIIKGMISFGAIFILGQNYF